MSPEDPDARILVVDDNVFVLDSTAALLREWGYRVEPCNDPEEAVIKARESSFDVVLTDIKMPKITGIELLEKVREFNKDLPVILMTAYAELDVAIDAIHRGAHDFIVKPFKPAYLLNILKKAINYHRLLEMEKNYKRQLEEEVMKRTQELAGALKLVEEVSKEITQRLVTASGFRDTETGAHIRRIGMYS
ncbi:MAG: response regulator, partial [Deltaproteobacteria bacterium]|nr:response regulator [Deltaproteobacteria bacterium]